MKIGTIIGMNLVGIGMVMRILPFIFPNYNFPTKLEPISTLLMILGFFVMVFSITGIFDTMLGKKNKG